MQSDAGQGKDCSSPSPRKRRRDTSRMTVKEEVDDAGQGEDELEEEAKPVIKKGAKARQPKKIDGPSPGGWTPEKRAVFIEKVLAAGYKALDLDDVAKEVSRPAWYGKLTPSSSSTSAS